MSEKYDVFLQTENTLSNLPTLKYFSTGPLAEIILEKTLFQDNKEIKSFTKEVIQIDYRDYLFAGRPTLYARVVKDIYREKDDLIALERIIRLKKFLEENKEQLKVVVDNAKNSKVSIEKRVYKKRKTNPILDWGEIINPRDGN